MELGTVKVINGLGPLIRSTVVALDGRYGAAASLSPTVQVALATPPRPAIGKLRGLALRPFLRGLAPDLLVTHNWGSVHGLIGAILGRVGPIIHQEHGYGVAGATAPPWKQLIAYRLLLRAVDAMIVPSRHLAVQAHRSYGVAPGRIRRIPNGVDVQRFTPRRDAAWRRAHGVPDDAVLFGWVGRLREEKHLPLLLRAFAQAGLDNGWLAVVGDGPRQDDWQRLAHHLGIDGRVVFAGQADDPAPCYAAFDVFTMSSTTEQMPNVLLEAMASGLPAICTDVGDSREMLGDDCWIVPPGDVGAYARALTALAEDAGQRQALGVANRARSVEEYPLHRMIDSYREAFDDVLSRAGRPMVTPERRPYDG